MNRFFKGKVVEALINGGKGERNRVVKKKKKEEEGVQVKVKM